MDDNNILVNFSFDDSSIGRESSITSRLKQVGGGWKERKKLRKIIKRDLEQNIPGTIKPEFNTTITQKNRSENTVSKKEINNNHNNPSNAPVNDFSSFIGMGLNPDLVLNMKNKLGVEKPTTIQSKAIPIILSSVINKNNQDNKQNKQVDVIIQAETGSGKTLTYLLPIIHRMINATIEINNNNSNKNIDGNMRLSRFLGTFAIILAPTRELANQILSVLNSLTSLPNSKFSNCHINHWIVPGLIIGGEKKKAEKARLRKGVNILVCTPGRLLDHLQNTRSFVVEGLRWLILDEADRLLELGFEETLKEILKLLEERINNNDSNNTGKSNSRDNLLSSSFLPQKRQTILCSATLRDDVRRLADHSLVDPIFIGGDSKENSNEESSIKYSNPIQLKHKYAITPAKLRLVTLTAILKSIFENEKDAKFKKNSKVVVFMTCCDSVDFHFDLFNNSKEMDENYHGYVDDDDDGSIGSSNTFILNTTLFQLHGNLSQEIRIKTFNKFCQAKSGILFCTDVAARGLDLPDVTNIIQYDAPTDLKSYVHRAGRTARLGKDGEAIIFLLPSEIEYIDVLKAQGVIAEQIKIENILETLASFDDKKKEYEFKAQEIQLQFERYVLSNEKSIELAQRAFISHVRAYATHPSSEKHIFHPRNLHLGHIAKSFALREAPSNIKLKNVYLERDRDRDRGNIVEDRRDTRNNQKKRRYDSDDNSSKLKGNIFYNIKKIKLGAINEFSTGDYDDMIGPTTRRKKKNTVVKKNKN
ncbi:9153_t:CDS:2 [Entrophospora sp. SA101]|nr:3550_t:CDS:2 [Entrophospora sp. SA101]CAJ0824770.1 9153_t:CDS:2 [Entrophospora sp. SA101]CAJ0924461.1 9728_t:CDS:2 [Entrophospora sp. SA101]